MTLKLPHESLSRSYYIEQGASHEESSSELLLKALGHCFGARNGNSSADDKFRMCIAQGLQATLATVIPSLLHITMPLAALRRTRLRSLSQRVAHRSIESPVVLP